MAAGRFFLFEIESYLKPVFNRNAFKSQFTMPLSDEENCAVRADGTLKDASEITWLNSPSDETPVSEGRILADDRVRSDSTQEASPPPVPPQREKRQIKLTS